MTQYEAPPMAAVNGGPLPQQPVPQAREVPKEELPPEEAARVVVSAWLGVRPAPSFYKRLFAAQGKVAPIEKDTKNAERPKQKYSKTEDWIAEGRSYFLDQGLIAAQVGGALVGSVLRVHFAVIEADTGTGLLCVCDWPALSFMGGKAGQAADGTLAAFTRTWKAFIRGFLAVPQVEEGEEFGNMPKAPPERQQERQAPRQQESNVLPFPGAPNGYDPRYDQPPQQLPQQQYEQLPFDPRYGPPQAHAAWQGGPPHHQQSQVGFYGGVGVQPGPWPEQGVPHSSYPQQQPYQQPPQQQRGPGGGAPPGPATRQGPLPPVQHEPVVRAAAELLGAEPVVTPNTRAPEPQRTADGIADVPVAVLLGLGWNPTFAQQVGTVGPNDQVPDQIGEELKLAIGEFFEGNAEAAFGAWVGTGFTPQKGGPKPTGAQVRRYMTKLDWRKKQNANAAPAAGR